MVNNYPEYAAGVNFKKTDSNGVRHFYSAQVVADPSDETIESKLIKDGVAISEGGSSDFSTAEVTIIVSGSLASATVLVPNISDSDEFSGIYSDINITRGDSNPITCVLYKGHAAFSSQYLITDSSGNVEVDGTDAMISGDCTITISSN